MSTTEQVNKGNDAKMLLEKYGIKTYNGQMNFYERSSIVYKLSQKKYPVPVNEFGHIPYYASATVFGEKICPFCDKNILKCGADWNQDKAYANHISKCQKEFEKTDDSRFGINIMGDSPLLRAHPIACSYAGKIYNGTFGLSCDGVSFIIKHRDSNEVQAVATLKDIFHHENRTMEWFAKYGLNFDHVILGSEKDEAKYNGVRITGSYYFSINDNKLADEIKNSAPDFKGHSALLSAYSFAQYYYENYGGVSKVPDPRFINWDEDFVPRQINAMRDMDAMVQSRKVQDKAFNSLGRWSR